MKRGILCALIAVIVVSSGTSTYAQWGVGVKIPPVHFPAFLVSYTISETQMLELDVSYQSTRLSSITSMGVSGDLFGHSEEVSALSIAPFLGVGARIALISLQVLGQTVSTTILSANILWGAESHIPGSRYNVFAEVRHSLSFIPIELMSVGVALGARLEF